jgi:cytosine/adenosine deaminase-related metal-dependent hydrolase
MTTPAGGLRAVPGRVNAHTHLYSGLAALGLPPPTPPPTRFVEILERLWWRLDRALDAESLRAGARLYVAEALLHGTTTLVDHHESPAFIEGSLDVLADVCQELGMRALLCYGATERNRGRDEAREGLRECGRFARSNARPLVRGLVGLHASFTVSDATLEEAGEMCRGLGVVTHVHVAEDRADIDDAKSRGYAGPLERLVLRGALPAGSVLAHGVHLDAGQVRAAGDRGLWLVQNPRSNRGNGVGFGAALAASRHVALGTDGWPSDMDEECAALVAIAREQGIDLGPDTATDRLLAGARLVAERFAPDATAGDTVEFDPAPGPGAHVARVVIGDRVVVDEGRLVAADLAEIRARAAEQAERVGRRMEALA